MQRETLEIWARLGIGQARRRPRHPVARRPDLRPRTPAVRESPPGRRRALPAVRQHQPVRGRGAARGARRRARRSHPSRSPLHRPRPGRRRRRRGLRDRCRPGHASVRLPGRDRWRALVGAPRARHRLRRLQLRRPIPHRDVRAQLPFSHERHFHLDPPWNPGRQVLIHPQPDGVWRIDWQVPPETDADVERAAGGLDRRIRDVIGAETPYELVWVTAYRFSQRLAERVPRRSCLSRGRRRARHVARSARAA